MSASSLDSQSLIQNAIMDLARATDYHQVLYTDGVSSRIVAPSLKPRSVLCNEYERSFEPDGNHGKGYRLYSSSWKFMLVLVFAKEVSILSLTNKLCEEPLKIKDSGGKFIGMVELRSYSAGHPTTNSSSPGSEFTLLFSINKFRK